ncbi:DUF3024 domain-containing protein [Maribacter sp. 2307ULW6-5]|uniref:DUF3024 domain-containing protein n=1 Tax=Maribacter sp. 2307ULW6-5 TaxID=3386275 RepID=UPI0039BCFAB6
MDSSTTDINELTIRDYIESLRPEDPEIRKELDYGHSFDGKVAELFALRPVFDDPNTILQLPFAKVRYFKSKQLWRLYWKRARGTWEIYEPYPEATHLTPLLEVVQKDDHGCFFG